MHRQGQCSRPERPRTCHYTGAHSNIQYPKRLVLASSGPGAPQATHLPLNNKHERQTSAAAPTRISINRREQFPLGTYRAIASGCAFTRLEDLSTKDQGREAVLLV